MEQRVVGLNLGLRTRHRAVVYDGAVRRGKAFGVEVTREGFDELLRRATDGVDGPVTFVMEPTGLAWVPLAGYVGASGHRVLLANPQKVSDLRRFLSKHTKTDVIDADVCARLPEVDPEGVQALQVPTAEQTSLRRLVKRRERLMAQVAKTKQRVQALFLMANPALMDALGGEKFGRAAVAFYRQHADPEPVVRRGPKPLQRLWNRHSRGQADPDRASKVFEACRTTVELYAELRRQGQLPFDYVQVQDEIRAEVDRIEQVEKEVDRLQKQIEAIYVRLDPERTLEQLRGISSVIAPAIEALVGNVLRFPNGRRFVSYSGLAPRKRKSGFSDPSMPITKAGQRLLKKYFYLAAEVARLWDPDFAAYYARRYAQGDPHKRIVVALARKMALRVYALLKRRERAREATAKGEQAVVTTYVLRDAEGCQISKSQARQLIVEKYRRDVAAPERAERDHRRKGKTGGHRVRDKSGRREDATHGTQTSGGKQE